MKYITKFLSLAAILIISACHSSQQISNQPRDKQQWLSENGKKIQRMSRQDYCKLDRQHQLWAWPVLSPKQRRQFWLEKIDEVQKSFTWTNEEAAHIRSLSEFINTHKALFDFNAKGYEKSHKEYSEFFTWWYQKGEELGWSKRLMQGIAESLNRLVNKDGLRDGGYCTKE